MHSHTISVHFYAFIQFVNLQLFSEQHHKQQREARESVNGKGKHGILIHIKRHMWSCMWLWIIMQPQLFNWIHETGNAAQAQECWYCFYLLWFRNKFNECVCAFFVHNAFSHWTPGFFVLCMMWFVPSIFIITILLHFLRENSSRIQL